MPRRIPAGSPRSRDVTPASRKAPRGVSSRGVLAATIMLALGVSAALAHDLFLKPDDYFLAPDASVRVRVLNGNFEQSQAAVTFDRVTDMTVIGPAGVSKPTDHAWRVMADTSMFTARVGRAGTYLLAVSTRPRVLALPGAEFNAYLESDGIPDILEARRRNGLLDEPSRERYSKHVKAIVQVGEARTAGLDQPLGYPAEIIPMENPYALSPNGTLRVRTLVEGSPVANQLVLAGGRTPSGARHAVQRLRTDAEGVARVRLSAGTWYVKFIHMERVEADTINYESKWATLTFAIR